MKNIYRLLGVGILISSCTAVVESPMDLLINNVNDFNVETKEKQYPYFPVSIKEFGIRYNDVVTSENTTIRIREKEVMLERMDFLRFVLNTPEFEKEMLKASVYADSDISGTEGTVKKGEKFDSRRLLNALRHNSHSVRIIKGEVIPGAAAQAPVGAHIYVHKPAFNKDHTYYVEFPYTHQWDTGGYLQENYLSELLFHELLHNMGFNHKNQPDPIRAMEIVFRAVVDDPSFKEKYSKQIASFKPFYAVKYKDLVQENTRILPSWYSDELKTYNSDEIVEICIIYEDGTYEVRKMKNGKFI